MEMVSRTLTLTRLEANSAVTLLVSTTVASFEEKAAVLKTPAGENGACPPSTESSSRRT